MDKDSLPGASPDPWRTIENPITGEVLTFVERSAERCVLDLTLPPGQVPIAVHSHTGREHFLVLKGDLRVTVSGVVHDLGEGQEMAVKQEFHSPTNVSGTDVTFRVTCEPGYFAERGLRGAFGMANDGRIGPDGKPRDFLTLALLSERGKYRVEGVPGPVWRVLMTGLGAGARLAGRRKVLDGYWPPDLPRPW